MNIKRDGKDIIIRTFEEERMTPETAENYANEILEKVNELKAEQRMTPERQRAVEICEYIKNHCREIHQEQKADGAQFCQEAIEGSHDCGHDGIKRINERNAKEIAAWIGDLMESRAARS